jgi:membrane protein DedA with SNARE-associated domain
MIEWFQSLLPHLQNLGIAGYWLLALVTFGESFVLTGMFVPGTVLLVIMGGLVPQGFYDFGDLAFFAVCGSIVGDAVSYELGRLGRLHVDRYRFLKGYLERGRSYFHAHGGKSVIMGRFIGPIRPIIPFTAGVSDMKRGPFYVYNVLSAVGWSVAYLLLGYAFGIAWKSALKWSSAAVAGVVLIVIAVYIGVWFFKRKPQR